MRLAVGLVAMVIAGALSGCPGGGMDETGDATSETTDGTTGAATSTSTSTTGTTGATSGVDDTGTADSTTDGSGCDSDVDCGEDEVCVDAPGGECACAVGLARCGSECTNLRVNDSHCGRCNLLCPMGESCSQGVCGGLVDTPGIDVGAPELVSGGAPETECLVSNEAKPERSMNWFSGGVADVVGVQSTPSPPAGGDTAVADPMGTWSGALRPVPIAASANINALNGDPWVTTHGAAGLEYASFIGVVDDPNALTWCPAVAATDAVGLATNDWLAPASCAVQVPSGLRADGGVIRADRGSDALYIAYTGVTTNESIFTAARFSPCLGPVVGDDVDCPFDGFVIGVPNVSEHPNLVVNPCTHHPIALFRTQSAAVYRIADLEGNQVAAGTVDDDAPFSGNSNCGGAACPSDGEICVCGGIDGSCGDEPGCWDLARRVHAATKYDQDTGTCRLYAAYDRLVVASDGETYMKARLRIFDITDEAAVTLLSTFDASGPTSPSNDFSAAVTADYFTGGVGFFFYTQAGGNACLTNFVTRVSDDGGNSFSQPMVISGPFPSLRAQFTDGMGHYTEAADFTEPGVLLATWSEPVTITPGEPCIPCQGDQLSLATYAVRVRP